jgi:hypothetical protein
MLNQPVHKLFHVQDYKQKKDSYQRKPDHETDTGVSSEEISADEIMNYKGIYGLGESAKASIPQAIEEPDDSGKGKVVQKQEAEKKNQKSLKEQLDEIEKNYRSIIKSARTLGFNVAADNLEHFLDGKGTKKIISDKWLKSYSEIRDAQEVNQKRFEASLLKKADALKDGQTITFSDYWDRGIYAKGLNELFYASGGSTLTSTGTFTLSRKGNIVTITGTVDNKWHDPYDWHAGLTAFVPGHGNVSDSDALLLQKYRGAKPFEMESTWKSNLKGSIETDRWFDFTGTEFTWSE